MPAITEGVNGPQLLTLNGSWHQYSGRWGGADI